MTLPTSILAINAFTMQSVTRVRNGSYKHLHERAETMLSIIYFIGTEIYPRSHMVNVIRTDSKRSQSGAQTTKFHREKIAFVQSATRTTKFHK